MMTRRNAIGEGTQRPQDFDRSYHHSELLSPSTLTPQLSTPQWTRAPRFNLDHDETTIITINGEKSQFVFFFRSWGRQRGNGRKERKKECGVRGDDAFLGGSEEEIVRGRAKGRQGYGASRRADGHESLDGAAKSYNNKKEKE
jgi:hypothetical protein